MEYTWEKNWIYYMYPTLPLSAATAGGRLRCCRRSPRHCNKPYTDVLFRLPGKIVGDEVKDTECLSVDYTVANDSVYTFMLIMIFCFRFNLKSKA
jgi:hypothetical protein